MKIVVERDRLHAVLTYVMGRIDTSSKIPILTHVLLGVENGLLTVTATDLDSSASSWIEAEQARPGAFAAPADRLRRLVGGLPSGAHVSIEADEKVAQIKSGRSSYKLPILPSVDFPTIERLKGAESFVLPSATAKSLFDKVRPAVETGKSARFHLSGAFLYRPSKRTLAAVATNGHCLVKIVRDFDGAVNPQIIIPKEALDEIIDLAGIADELTFSSNKHQIAVEAGNCRFVSKLVDATFPDCDRVIPEKVASPVDLNRGDFVAALTRLSLLEGEHAFSLRFDWDQKAGTLTATSSGEGQGEEILPTDKLKSSGYIAFAPRVLMPMLGSTDGERVQLHVAKAHEGVLIVDPADKGVIAVAMPVGK